MIPDRDVAFYREQGYLVVSGVLEPSRVEVLRRELDALLEMSMGIPAAPWTRPPSRKRSAGPGRSSA